MFLARLLVLFSLVCISCAHSSFEQKQLKHALDFATSNRLELGYCFSIIPMIL